MKKSLFTGFMLTIIFFGACVKNSSIPPDNPTTYDTIKPLSYFPAFPGTYWVYNNQDTLKVVDDYEKYIYNAAAFDAIPDYDTLILPKLILNGFFTPTDSFAYVNGYSISQSTGVGSRNPPFKTILSLTEGAEFTIGGAYQNHKITGKTIKVDTSLFVGENFYDEVIITIQFDYACTSGTGGSPEDCATVREYYQKNVGLIKREVRNYPMDTTFVSDVELESYYIDW